jgi:hypothetical protein
MAELMKKMDVTNKLLEELLDVVKRPQFRDLDFESDIPINQEDTEETNLKSTFTEDSFYQSPALRIQKERDELVLRNEAYRIKQRIKAEWSRILNNRKQAYWKQVNNANHAEYFEKWLNQDNLVLPRKFRIKEIPGEPEEQAAICINVAKSRVRGEITLLCMRAENNQKNVSKLDEEMDQKLKDHASGLALEILQNLWKLECQKEEDKSFSRWQKTETWLDYGSTYGREITKQTQGRHRTSGQRNRTAVRNQAQSNTYASAVRNNVHSTEETMPTTINTQNDKANYSRPRRLNQPLNRWPARDNERRSNPHNNFKNSTKLINNPPRNFCCSNMQGQDNQPPTRRYKPRNIYWNERTTFIGRGVRHHFLGGGKPDQGQNFIRPFYQQTSPM